MGVRVLSVISGKGGVGKSHLSVNVATLAAAAGHRVLLIDADGGLSNADVLLGVTPQRHVGELLGGKTLDEVIEEVRPRLHLMAGAPGERRLAQLNEDDRRCMRAAWSVALERFEVIVVDVASGAGDDALYFASASDEPLLVVTDEPTSLADAVTVLHGLERSTAVRSVRVVVSAVRTVRSAQAVFARLSTLAGQTRLRLLLAPHVPEDQNLRRAAMARRPLVELAPSSPASRAFEQLVDLVLRSPRAGPAGGAFLVEAQLRRSTA